MRIIINSTEKKSVKPLYVKSNYNTRNNSITIVHGNTAPKHLDELKGFPSHNIHKYLNVYNAKNVLKDLCYNNKKVIIEDLDYNAELYEHLKDTHDRVILECGMEIIYTLKDK